jgi:hypothetical protein
MLAVVDSNTSSPEVQLVIWGGILAALEGPGVTSNPSPIIDRLSNVTLENAFDIMCISFGDLGFPLETEGLVEPFKVIAPCLDLHEINWPLRAIWCALLIKLAPTQHHSSSTENHSNLLIAILERVVAVYDACDKLKQMDIMPGATIFREIVKRCLCL